MQAALCALLLIMSRRMRLTTASICRYSVHTGIKICGMWRNIWKHIGHPSGPDMGPFRGVLPPSFRVDMQPGGFRRYLPHTEKFPPFPASAAGQFLGEHPRGALFLHMKGLRNRLKTAGIARLRPCTAVRIRLLPDPLARIVPKAAGSGSMVAGRCPYQRQFTGHSFQKRAYGDA